MNEVVDYTRRSKGKGLVLTFDLEITYDHVNWRFLNWIMERKELGHRWGRWIQVYLSSFCFVVIVNGKPQGWVKASSGLRQGHSLSPFLIVDV